MTVRPEQGADRILPGTTIASKTSVVCKVDDIPDSGDIVATWELTDDENYVLANGNAATLNARTVHNGLVVTTTANITIPSNIAAAYEGSNYYIVWNISWPDFETSATEEIEVFAFDAVEFGLENTVGMVENKVAISGIVATTVSRNVLVQVYAPDDTSVLELNLAPTNSNPQRCIYTSDFLPGALWYIVNGSESKIVYNPTFHATLPTYTLPDDLTIYGYDPERSYALTLAESLDPYTLRWKFANSPNEFIGTSQSWVINNYISQAMSEMQAVIERNLRVPGLAQSALSNADYAQFLKIGRDFFNSLEKITNFTMTKADGHMRRMWLICAQYEALQSRQLEEAIKAFDFSGQSTSLTIDLSSAYDLMRSNMEAQLENVKQYKRQLAVRGIVAGEGDNASLAQGRAATASGHTYSSVGTAGYTRLSSLSPYLRVKQVMF